MAEQRTTQHRKRWALIACAPLALAVSQAFAANAQVLSTTDISVGTRSVPMTIPPVTPNPMRQPLATQSETQVGGQSTRTYAVQPPNSQANTPTSQTRELSRVVVGDSTEGPAASSPPAIILFSEQPAVAPPLEALVQTVVEQAGLSMEPTGTAPKTSTVRNRLQASELSVTELQSNQFSSQKVPASLAESDSSAVLEIRLNQDRTSSPPDALEDVRQRTESPTLADDETRAIEPPKPLTANRTVPAEMALRTVTERIEPASIPDDHPLADALKSELLGQQQQDTGKTTPVPPIVAAQIETTTERQEPRLNPSRSETSSARPATSAPGVASITILDAPDPEQPALESRTPPAATAEAVVEQNPADRSGARLATAPAESDPQGARQPTRLDETTPIPVPPEAVATRDPVIRPTPNASTPIERDGADRPRDRNNTADDPFMISQMDPNSRFVETDLPLFDQSMPEIDNAVARLQLDEWISLIQTAVNNNPAVRVAEFGERVAEATVSERSASLYPQVSLGVSGAVERSVRDGERTPSLAGMEADNRFQVNPELTLTQLLFDGGATEARVGAAESQGLVATRQRLATEQAIAVRAAENLITLAKTQEQLQIAEAHLDEVERIRDMIRQRVNSGREAPSEMISLNARVFEARNRIRAIQTEQAAATAEFREVFAAPPVILAFPDVFAPIPTDPRYGFDLAMVRNPDIQASQAAIDVALSEFNAAKGDGLPRIEVEARASGFDTFNRGDDYYDSSIGLRMTTELFDGGRQEAQVQRALNSLESARFQYDRVVNAVERILNAAYAERVNLIPQFKASQAKRDQEIATREAYTEQWLAGRRPLNDLLTAQDRIFDNSMEAIELKSSLHRQHFFILSLLGELAASRG